MATRSIRIVSIARTSSDTNRALIEVDGVRHALTLSDADCVDIATLTIALQNKLKAKAFEGQTVTVDY